MAVLRYHLFSTSAKNIDVATENQFWKSMKVICLPKNQTLCGSQPVRFENVLLLSVVLS